VLINITPIGVSLISISLINDIARINSATFSSV
jgi:hypothetical protein